ncbi:MAG: Fic family protein [Dermatophilaceae bacterium]
MLFSTPDLTLEDHQVLEAIHSMRSDLADVLRTPRRWEGSLRRSMLARAIRGSNSIEGYYVEVDDAVAALDDEEPLSADERTFAEIRGYRQALGYVLAMAGDEQFVLDASAIRSMHFMMLAHDVAKSPGSYRAGPVYVYDEGDRVVVYEGPEASVVPELMDELVADLASHDDVDLLVRAAMAHLNLVMVHPFRDGNGRMARALQTLVLSRGGIAEPAFSSIEEWLGANTDDYYRVLAITGAGSWHPDRDCGLWLSFNLRAHHMQAQTTLRRFRQANALWAALDELAVEYSLSERVTSLLFDALLGYRLRRTTHVKRAEIEERTATRDFKRLVDLGLLRAVGETRARHYVAAKRLQELRQDVLADTERRIVDPYPWMRPSLLTESIGETGSGSSGRP